MPSLLHAMTLALVAALPAAPALAQTWPAKPVRLILTFPPGGFTDVTARIVAAHWTERLGQPVLVENRPGAGTVIGTEAVAKSAPDGYTLLYTGASTFTINPIVLKNLPYDTQKSLVPVGIVGTTAMLILANPGVPQNNVRDLAAQMKAKPASFNYGSFGTGTVSHFAGELLWTALGVRPLHVPYKGSGPLMTALVSGEVPLSVDTLVVAAPQIRAGKIKGLAVTTATRSSLLPDIPTLEELGYAGVDIGAWVAIAAPAGTPEAVLARLHTETQRLPDVRDVREKFAAAGVEVVGSTPGEMSRRIAAELAKNTEVARAADIRAE